MDIDAKERSREAYEVAIGKYPQVEKAFLYNPKLQDIGLLIANVFIINKLHLPTIPTGLDFIVKYDFKDYIYFTIDIASRYVNLIRMNHLALHVTTVHTAGWGLQFEFGEPMYEGPAPTYENPSTYSSCMTTVESPIGSRLQYCDTREVCE